MVEARELGGGAADDAFAGRQAFANFDQTVDRISHLDLASDNSLLLRLSDPNARPRARY
jgi:hypothetical protein